MNLRSADFKSAVSTIPPPRRRTDIISQIGKIFVKYKQKLHISGTYSLDSLFQPNYPGLSSMLGEFTGAENTDDNTVVLNTNPKNTNNNVMLELKLEANKIIGKWYYSSSNAKGIEGILSGMKLK